MLDALGRRVEVELPDELVEEKAEELLYSLARGFERRGVPLAAWLRSTGKTAEEVRDELQPEAVDALSKEIALEAFAEREGIEIDDARLEQLLREDAEGAGRRRGARAGAARVGREREGARGSAAAARARPRDRARQPRADARPTPEPQASGA